MTDLATKSEISPHSRRQQDYIKSSARTYVTCSEVSAGCIYGEPAHLHEYAPDCPAAATHNFADRIMLCVRTMTQQLHKHKPNSSHKVYGSLATIVRNRI